MTEEKKTRKRIIVERVVRKAGAGAEPDPYKLAGRPPAAAVATAAAADSLRDFVRQRLRSTGGRPGLDGADRARRKVPLFREDLVKLEELARRFSDDKLKVTPMQVAACIVHRALEEL